MGVIRSLIGGLIGAVIAVAISSFLNVEAYTGYAWFPIVTGFLTGLGAMVIGGKNFGISSVISGVAAAAIALVAILAGADAALLVTQSTAEFGPTLSKEQAEKSSMAAEAALAKESTDSPSEEEGTDNGDEDESEESQSTEPGGTSTKAALQFPGRMAGTKAPFDLPKFVYSLLGVLVAYQMGRGFGSKKKPEEVFAEIA